MTAHAVTTIVGSDEIPATIRRRAPMSKVDYADVYTAVTPMARNRSPESWLRAALEETPAGGRARTLWQLLGLRLGPANSPNHVQGWTIADRGDDWIRVETSSWWASAHAVCHVDDEHVSLALFLHYEQPVGRLIWLPVAPMHQRGVPVLFEQARRLRELSENRTVTRSR